MTRRWLALGVAAAVLAAVALVLARRPGADLRLPPEMPLRDVVADLSGAFDARAVTQQAPDAAVRAGDLAPNPYFKKGGGRRAAVLVPPPSRVRFHVHVPPNAVLEFGVGVEGAGERDASMAGVRFSLLEDGQEVFARTVNPAATRKDRRWFDERVTLHASADRDVDLTLVTDPAGAGALAGTPGWSRVRVVQESTRARAASTPAAPNVLVLLVDTLRADRLGAYGATPSPTPALDGLAASGLVFSNATSQSSWTMPAVASLFTGLQPARHGVVGENPDASFLSDALPTLATVAQRAGITTVGVSANFLVSRGTNFARGFETFRELPEDPDSPAEATARDVNETFLAWLAANPRHRFFAYLHYMEPHEPYTPPAPFRSPPPQGLPAPVVTGRVKDLTYGISHGRRPPLPAPDVDYLRHLYDGEVRTWDAALEMLLDGLADAGVRDSTVVVVIADHGEEFQEHGRLGHGTQLYDEVLHVPLVIAGPGVPVGRVDDRVQGIDLFPTLAAIFGATPPPGLPGENLLGPRTERPVISETRGAIGPDGKDIRLLSLRTPRWKLIHAPALGRYELYDLAQDPGEHADRFAEAVEGPALAAELAAWVAAAPPPPAAGGRDAMLREKLQALGYVE